MSTKILHGQMSNVDEQGNVQILHQETSASDVLVNKNLNTNGESGASAIPASVTNAQTLTNELGTLAFKSGDYLMSSDDDENDEIPTPETEIDDSTISENTTWSSIKIAHMIAEAVADHVNKIEHAEDNKF
jgi:3-dehydroquinate synthase class II